MISLEISKHHITSRTKRHTKCRIIFGIKCDGGKGGGGKEDIRKGRRVSTVVAARIHLQMQVHHSKCKTCAKYS